MESLEKKMKVEVRTKVEKKRIKLHKLLDFLSLKLCIHQNCSQIKHMTKSTSVNDYLEVMIWWHSAYYSRLLMKKGEELEK